jgi:hypothetical protein
VTIAFAVFLSLPAAARMYKCTAKDGTVLYQARPCVGTEREATLANGTLADGDTRAVMNVRAVPRDTERAVLGATSRSARPLRCLSRQRRPLQKPCWILPTT